MEPAQVVLSAEQESSLYTIGLCSTASWPPVPSSRALSLAWCS